MSKYNKKQNAISVLLQSVIFVIMITYLILQALFVGKEGYFILIPVALFNLAYLLAIIVKTNIAVISFILLNIALLFTLFATGFANGIRHHVIEGYISVSSDGAFIFISYITAAVVTNILSVINILFFYEKRKKSN